jgi:serpin B
MTATLVAWSVGGCVTNFKASTVDGAVKASNAFGFDFYREVRKGKDDIVCSPAGAAIALTMVAAGARGETQTEILHTVHIDPANLDQTYGSFAAVLDGVKAHDGKDGLVLSAADRVWVQKDLKLLTEYQSLLRDTFRAPVVELDFAKDNQAALAAINQWASDETHGRIPRILGDVTGPMVLANAIYMMGEWQQPFAESATADSKFISVEGETSVRMMRQVSGFRYAQVRGAKLVELPYKGGLSMIVVLPDDVDGVEKIEDRAGSSYTDWIAALEYRQVNLKLPHFTTATELNLSGPLEELGIRQAFDRDAADFSGMTGGRGLFIGRAIQKAWIETSEKGTEAAAVTVIEMMDDSATVGPEPPPPVIFHADHPFMYLIRDMQSGEILFIGRVVKPAT